MKESNLVLITISKLNKNLNETKKIKISSLFHHQLSSFVSLRHFSFNQAETFMEVLNRKVLFFLNGFRLHQLLRCLSYVNSLLHHAQTTNSSTNFLPILMSPTLDFLLPTETEN